MSAPEIIYPPAVGGGAPVGGTGTTNTIPRWTGPSTLGDSGLIDNGTAIYTTTRNVGIGTASPGASLHVRGGGGTINSILDSSTSGDTRTELRNNGTRAGYIYWDASEVRAFADTGRFLSFYAGASERARIDSAGNFGIGTASPGSYEASARQLVVGSGTGNQGITIAGSSNLNLYFATGTTGALPYRGFIRYDAADDSMWFATTSTVRWKVTGTGHFIANVDNTYDIGASGATRPRTVYVGTSFDASASGAGLKLPATPGNADTQTLDCYRENTWTPTITGLGNCSAVTISDASFTQIGRLVTIQGKIDLTVTAATTATSFQFSLPVNRGTTTLAGCGAAVDNTNFAMGGVYNAGANNTTAYVVFPAAAGFGAGSARIWAFSYSYFTAT